MDRFLLSWATDNDSVNQTNASLNRICSIDLIKVSESKIPLTHSYQLLLHNRLAILNRDNSSIQRSRPFNLAQTMECLNDSIVSIRPRVSEFPRNQLTMYHSSTLPVGIKVAPPGPSKVPPLFNGLPV